MGDIVHSESVSIAVVVSFGSATTPPVAIAKLLTAPAQPAVGNHHSVPWINHSEQQCHYPSSYKVFVRFVVSGPDGREILKRIRAILPAALPNEVLDRVRFRQTCAES